MCLTITLLPGSKLLSAAQIHAAFLMLCHHMISCIKDCCRARLASKVFGMFSSSPRVQIYALICFKQDQCGSFLHCKLQSMHDMRALINPCGLLASSKGTHVHGCLQVVDTAKFNNNGTKGTDFDVNNLKLSPKGLEIKNNKTAFPQGLDISSILQHIRSKSLWILEPPLTVTDRIANMQGRDWRILNQYT